MKTLLVLFSIYLIAPSGHTKVDPPNYDFSLDTLEDFAPGKKVGDIKNKYKKLVMVKDTDELKIYKAYISHIRYKFPVFIAIDGDKVKEFYAVLPRYFLHDVFHQSLINRHGKQNEYLKKEEGAIYVWNKSKGVKHIYRGACTITCFPLYYSQMDPSAEESSLINYFQSVEPF